MPKEALQEFYRDSEAYADMLTFKTEHPYTDFIDAAIRSARPGAAVLEIGCGVGRASHALSEAGFAVFGLDVGLPSLRRAAKDYGDTVRFLAASASRLPFRDASFDVVAAEEVLEHLLDPHEALVEMCRVLRPGGRLLLIGPNLLSPVYSWRALIDTLRHQPPRLWLRRDPRAPTYPWGTTIPAVFAILLRNMLYYIELLNPRTARFHFRTPYLGAAGSDADAVCLANPIVVRRVLRREHLLVRSQRGSKSRSWWLGPFSGAVRVVGRKAGAGSGS